VIFSARRKTGALDLEALEMALPAALQQAGAAGLSELLQPESPAEPRVLCSCGGQARYKGMRSKPLLTVLGHVEMRRAYYWCSRCQQGQFSSDAALDVENTELSPGVRRMLTLVGSECSSFERCREEMKQLAGLEVTTKAVERTTESIGADIARREQDAIQQALQRELPIAVGQAIPVMYVQMDGTGVPMVSKELEGRTGKASNGRAHTREVKLARLRGPAIVSSRKPSGRSFLGRHEEALLHAGKAVELEPLDLMTNFRLLQANYYSRRYEEAVRCGRIAVELTPDSAYTYFYLALSLAAVGLKDEAWTMANTGKKLNDGLPLGEDYFGYVAGLLGHTSRLAAWLGSWRPVARKAMAPPCPLRGLISVSVKQTPPSTG
jgi:tetratricopeptide (TPR) repeat protein